MAQLPKKPIILFDGVCNLCNGVVQFVIKHDAKKIFLFASLQSETGQAILKKHNLSTENFTSFILADGNKLYIKSSAALNIAKKLGGIFSLFYAFIIVPPFIRNAVYSWVANNRYKWFGKQESCWLPTPELQSRFL